MAKRKRLTGDLLLTPEEREEKKRIEEQKQLDLIKEKAKRLDNIITAFGGWEKSREILSWSIAPHAYNKEFHRGAMAIFLQIFPYLFGISEESDSELRDIVSGRCADWNKEERT